MRKILFFFSIFLLFFYVVYNIEYDRNLKRDFILCEPYGLLLGKFRKCKEKEVRKLEFIVHGIVNRRRINNGLMPLKWNKKIYKVAKHHSKLMANYDFFSHIDLNGISPDERLKKIGFKCSRRIGGNRVIGAAENIFKGTIYYSKILIDNRVFYQYRTLQMMAEEIVSEWMKKENHKKNILSPLRRYEAIGIWISDNLIIYVTQDLC